MNWNRITGKLFSGMIVAVLIIIIITGLILTGYNFISDFSFSSLGYVINGWFAIFLLIPIVFFSFSGLGICIFFFQNIEDIRMLTERLRNHSSKTKNSD